MKKTILISAFILSLAAISIAVMVVFFADRKDQNELTLYGNVDVRQVDISFRVGGKINTLQFEEGDLVKKGDLMCALDLTPYDSELEKAIATGIAIKVALDHAEVLLNRRLDLIEIGAVSQEELDNARAKYDRLQANLIQVEEAIDIARETLSYTKAYAPTDGIILTRIREVGTVVNPTDPVYSLSISSPIWVRAFVDEPNLGRIFYGMEATVYTDVKGGRKYKGKIGFISPVAEFTPKTVETTELRTNLVYRLRIYVDNPDKSLVQGMPVTVKLNITE